MLVRREFLESMVDLAGAGRTVLLSSHQIGEVERVASHVALLHKGKLILAEPLDELKSRHVPALGDVRQPRPSRGAAGGPDLELIDAADAPRQAHWLVRAADRSACEASGRCRASRAWRSRRPAWRRSTSATCGLAGPSRRAAAGGARGVRTQTASLRPPAQPWQPNGSSPIRQSETLVFHREQVAHVHAIMVEGRTAVLADLGVPGPGRGGRRRGWCCTTVEPRVRGRAAGLLALICASLYAFAVGAAAFAGERETGTLRLLDILPLDRRVVWAGKVSFALVTTLALALVLLAMAALSTDRWKPEGSFSICRGTQLRHDRSGGAGVGAVLVGDLEQRADRRGGSDLLHGSQPELPLSRADNPLILSHVSLPISRSVRFSLFLATLLASVMIFARAMRWKRFQLEFRSPVVVNLVDSAGPRRVQLQVQSPVAAILAPMQARSWKRMDSLATDQSPRRSRVVEARALVWQTMRRDGKPGVCSRRSDWFYPLSFTWTQGTISLLAGSC